MPIVLDPPKVNKPKPLPPSKPKTWDMTPPQPYRWTRQEVYDLCSQGHFHDKKVMLIDGELFVMPMPNPYHDVSMLLLMSFLLKCFGEGFVIRNQMGLGIGNRTDPGPDFAVVTGAIFDYQKKHPTTALLVVEVADSSLEMDLKVKSHPYASVNVGEYWVLDINGRQLTIHRDPVADASAPRGFRYASLTVHRDGEMVGPVQAPHCSIDVAGLLPLPEPADAVPVAS